MANGTADPPACGVFDALGFAGLSRLEIPLLASLVTGEPLLLVGTHGSAKSALSRAVAEALGFRFHAYDAGKSLFEDVIGFPDPGSLASGQLRYVPTPLSIWDCEFVLVDELSRASPQMQSKWLEVVRARCIMGAKIPRLSHVWAAMNPLSYLGAQALDAALAGRFAWIVPMPEAGEMTPTEVAQLINTTGREDAPLAPELHVRPARGTGGFTLPEAVAVARSLLPEALREHGEFVSRYIQFLASSMPPGGALDGRRMGMMRRNLLSALAAAGALDAGGSGRAGRDRERLFREVTLLSMPFSVIGAEIEDMQVLCAHERAWLAAESGGEAARLDRVIAERDARRAARAWIEAAPALREEEHDRVLAHFLDAAIHATADRRVRAFADIAAVVEEVAAQPERFPPEVVARMLAWYARFTGMTRDHGVEVGEVIERRGGGGLHVPAEALSLRLALEVARPRPGAPEGEPDVASALQYLPSFRTALSRSTP